ncbi:MAG: DUF3078 domain-containing protein [Flavobacteriales bacterium]
MKIKIVVAAVATVLQIAAMAQTNPTADEEKNMKTLAAADSGWTKKGTVTIGVTGSYFNQWAAGGINSMGVNGLLNYGVNFRNAEHAWDNTLIIAYGMLNQGFATRDAWVKTDDRFDLTSKYGRPIKEKLFYAVLGNFNTQFAPGYAPGADGRPDRTKIISNFAAPARLLFSVGLDSKPREAISLFFSPITYRGIYVADELLAARGAFGVEPGYVAEDTLINGVVDDVVIRKGATARHEVGAYLRLNYSRKFTENFNLTSKFELFSNYLDTPQNIDLAWETIAAWKISKFFSITTTVNFLYDDNTNLTKFKNVTTDNGDGSSTTVSTPYLSKGMQTRIISTLGLTYNF